MTEEAFKNGQVLLIDKPLTWTSFQAVNKIRWHIKQCFGIKKIKVGHAGTLDPLASGLLIVCTGKKTKEIQGFQDAPKEYITTIKLGETTPSFDLETEIDQTYPTEHISEDLIHKTVPQFIGEIDQKPPMFSALKKDGVRLYDMAREGKSVEITARKITIAEFEITKIDGLNVDFLIKAAVFVLPLGNNYYKVGATFNWEDKTKLPTEEGKKELIDKLNTFITIPYTIVDHIAGIRPMVKDRRPLAGKHPKYKNIAVLNGLGTRGVMIAPVVAKSLYNHLENGLELDSEISIDRFQ